MDFSNSYNYLMNESIDPRTKDWFLVYSPVNISAILLLYCYLVLVGGPNYMRKRKPYSLKTFIQFYNVFQIIFNAYSIYSIIRAGGLKYWLHCMPFDTSTTGDGYDIAVAVWNFYMVKLIDLSETMIFVLRKKEKQVTLLHLYHHISTPFTMWLCTRWYPGGVMCVAISLNSLVHVIMYSYYLLSTGGAFMQRLAAPIKPWITIIQMTQLVIIFAHAIKYVTSSCEIPTVLTVVYVVNVVINFLFFLNFYIKNYRQKRD